MGAEMLLKKLEVSSFAEISVGSALVLCAGGSSQPARLGKTQNNLVVRSLEDLK